jgi:hypothetical protein
MYPFSGCIQQFLGQGLGKKVVGEQQIGNFKLSVRIKEQKPTRRIFMLKALLVSMFMGSIALAGDAGCGLGGMLIKSNTKLMQLFAVTTNGTLGSQTFGITFGTSGCSASGLVQNDKQIQYFVEVNQEDLMREMAEGRGEKLSTLAALNGCMSQEQITAFNSRAQSNFKTIVPASKTTAIDFVNNMKSSAIANVCSGT